MKRLVIDTNDCDLAAKKQEKPVVSVNIIAFFESLLLVQFSVPVKATASHTIVNYPLLDASRGI